MRSLLAALLNERFQELARIPDAPFLRASASFGTLSPATRAFTTSAVVADGGIEPGLRALVLELRRVREHGFGPAEIDRVRSTMLASVERAYEERERTESDVLVEQMLSHYLGETPMPGVGQRLRLAREILPGITTEDVHAMLEETLGQASWVVVVQAPEKAGLVTPEEGDLRLVIAAAESMAVTPWFDKVAGRSLLESTPEPGPVRVRREIPALGLTVLEFSNAAEAWLHPTDFKKDEVLISGYALGGASVVDPEDYPALSAVTGRSRTMAQVSAKSVEMFSLCADANQKVLREMVDLSATAAKEGVRLYAELLSSAVEAVKDAQGLLTSRQREIQEAPGDLAGFYQKSLTDSVEGAQKAWRILEGNAQAVTRSAERLQVTAEHAGQAIQATWSQLAGKAKSLYAGAA